MTRDVAVVGHGGAMGLELVGTCEVLELANWRRVQAGQEPAVPAARAEPGRGKPARLRRCRTVGHRIAAYLPRPIDMLVVAGGPLAVEASEDAELVEAVHWAAAKAERVVSLCTGAFLLASAGLLDGKRVTTHWLFGEQLAARYPKLTVDTDPIYVRDGNVWTTAALDLCWPSSRRTTGRKRPAGSLGCSSSSCAGKGTKPSSAPSFPASSPT